MDGLAAGVGHLAFDHVLAVESRGFVLGAPLAARFGCGFVMVRKPNKLPGDVETFPYTCEYCSGQSQISAGLVTLGTALPRRRRPPRNGRDGPGHRRPCREQRWDGRGLILLPRRADLSVGGRHLLTDAPVVTLLRY